MTATKETLWDIDPHTKAKHEILKRYLAAWFPILNTYHHRIVFLDGFCGPGRYKQGELGSPIISLDVAINHRKSLDGELVFWFIDEREDRIEHLKRELQKKDIPSHFKVYVEAGKFHEKFGIVLDSIDEDRRHLAPTFAFIDPFGFSGIPFSLIERLLHRKRCEALITFMVDAINRFLEHPDDKILQHIVDAFGTDEAKKIAKGSGDRIERLRNLYQSQLNTVAKYVRYFEMRDRHDRPQYFLFFATNNELGHLKMKEAMWRVDPDGDFRFSDATNPDQLVLFEKDTTSKLIDQLHQEFHAKDAISGQDVRKFVENKTAYLRKHMTVALKRMEGDEKIKVDSTKIDGKIRRAGTYPDEVKMIFMGVKRGGS